jgi:hypothetical protein
MAKKSNNFVFILGGILTVLGILAGLLDNTLSMWQLDNGLFAYHINAFGILSWTIDDTVVNLCSADEVVNPGNYLYAGIIALAGGLLAILGGAKGSKSVGFLGIIAIFGGLAYFYYSHVIFLGENPLISWIGGLGSSDGFALVWGENGPITWGMGFGGYISLAGAVVTMLGLWKK